MIGLRRCALALVIAVLHCSRIEGQTQQDDRRIKGDSNKGSDNMAGKKNQVLEEEEEGGQGQQLEKQEQMLVNRDQVSVKEEDASVIQEETSSSNVCGHSVATTIGQLIHGNNDIGTVDQGIAKECAAVTLPGAWYSINGTGASVRASVVEGNYTRIVVFSGSDCTTLSCADSVTPVVTVTTAHETSFWTTFWETEVGVTYHLYMYGIGNFQMMLAEQERPVNDRYNGAVALNVGDSIEGSTTYASPEKIIPCGSSAISKAPGLWFSITGTGSPLQASLRTASESYGTQVSIYNSQLECVANVERLEYFDPDSSQWYAISRGIIWDSLPGERYNIHVLGGDDQSPGIYEAGAFELTVVESSRPQNDNCMSASVLQVGRKEASATTFATIDDALVCSPVSLGESPTAPGVWYIVRGKEGPMEATVISAYASQLTVFSGDQCAKLVCMEGTSNAVPDSTDLVATNSSSVRWNARSNEIYRLLVHGAGSSVGFFELSLSDFITPSMSEGLTSTPVVTATQIMPNVVNSTASATSSMLWDVETTASMSFGFFPGTDVREPSENEINGLMDQASRFFGAIFQDAFDDAFVRFEAQEYGTFFDEENALPVVINFQAKGYFTSELAAPSATEVFNLMDGADFQDFIRNYAWQLEPIGATLFFETLRVVFGQANQDLQSSGMSESSGSQAESVQRVDAPVKMLFSFFPDADVRVPTSAEIDGLIHQTGLFFSAALDKEFDDFIRFGATATGTNFTTGNQLPVEVSLDIYVFFELTDINGNATEIHTTDQVLMAMRNAELTDFIQNYVWESSPFAENIFYDTMLVQIRPGVLNHTSTESAPADPQIVYTGNQASFDIALSFSFHDTATVTLREPINEEIEGMLLKTNEFFTELLQSELPQASGFGRLNLTATSVDYAKNREFAVVVVVSVDVTYNSGSDVSSRATPEQMLALLETANMNDYVEFYVWFAAPDGSIFFATNQAVLEPYMPLASTRAPPTAAPGGALRPMGSATNGNVASDATTEAAELLPVETDVTVTFFFFTPPTRIATTTELNALTSQTKEFFTKTLQETYPDLMQLDVNIITAGFAPSASSSQGAVVSWKVSALFYVLDGTGATRTPEHLLSTLTASDVEDYLHNHVWSAEPQGANFFFDASAALFELSGSNGLATAMPSSAPTPTPSPSQVVVRASILYGFLEDTVISRTPNLTEQNGLLFQTSLFFNKMFRESFPKSFKRANASIMDVELLGGNTLPISVSYEFVVQFNEDDFVPSSDALYAVMSAADFEAYIEFYVWSANQSAESMFFDTQHVVFQAMV